MLKSLIRRRMQAFGRHYGYDVGYMLEMLEISRPAFMRFSRVIEMARHHEDVPAAPLYAAKLAAVMAEDCGPCAQLTVSMAEEAGVPAQVLRAIVAGDEAGMGQDAGLAWRFAQAVLAHDPQADCWREQIRQRWGACAVVTLALSIAAGRVFPTVKYALGHGRSCQRLRVGGQEHPAHRGGVAALA